jgi:GNAT superfamily N-acetyltransferase
MRDFVEWHYDRHASDRAIIDSYFDPKKFDEELAALPGEFAPPGGVLLIAEEDGEVAGCVALRPLSEGTCEMKRMFVGSRFQGRGIGKLLAQAIIAEAKRTGYVTMMLDTGPKQAEAQTLYRSLGFTDRGPYYDLPPHLRDWLVFMELALVRTD